MGPPTGFCTPPDSIPVMVMSGPRIMAGNPPSTSVSISRKSATETPRSAVPSSSLFVARNIFNSSLKKLSTAVTTMIGAGEESCNISNTFNVASLMDNPSSPSILKIPTPSMLNQQLPPPMPVITTATNSGIDFALASSTSTTLVSTLTSKSSPQQRALPTIVSTTMASNLLVPVSKESLNINDDVFSTNSSLLQEEQAAAAALLGQFSNF